MTLTFPGTTTSMPSILLYIQDGKLWDAHTDAQVAMQLKFGNKLLPEKQSK